MKKICIVYRSSRHEGMYLYVDKEEDLARVPEALLSRFGEPQPAMTLLLHAGRPLARVDVNTVLAELERQGFFLQMPPQPHGGVDEGYMNDIRARNSKMQ